MHRGPGIPRPAARAPRTRRPSGPSRGPLSTPWAHRWWTQRVAVARLGPLCSDGLAQGPPSPDLTSSSLQSVTERPCPGHSASTPGKSSPQAPLLRSDPSSSLSPGGKRAGTQAGWAGGERTRPRGQPAPAKHPRPPGALRHQALPLHTRTHTQAHVCASTHSHTRTHTGIPLLRSG